MATIFIPIDGGAQVAEALSAGVYKLSQPDGVRPEGYATRYAFAWLTHPTTGAVAVRLDTNETIPCHMQADTAALLDLVAPITTQEERDALASYVGLNRGKTVLLAALIPPQATSRAMTQAQADAAGWFPRVPGDL